MIFTKTIFHERTVSVPVDESAAANRPIEIVVPFTTLEFTQAALDEADRLVHHLNVRIRVVAVQSVPVTLDLDRPPVSTNHLENTLRALVSSTPAHGEIYLVRDPKQTWAKLLRSRSLIVLASPKRFWITAEERLAKLLERNGHEVVLIYQRKTTCSI